MVQQAAASCRAILLHWRASLRPLLHHNKFPLIVLSYLDCNILFINLYQHANVIHIAIGELGIAAVVLAIVPLMIWHNIIHHFIFQEHFHFALAFRYYLPPGHLIANTIKTFRDSADLGIEAMNYSKHMAAILVAYMDLILHCYCTMV